MSAEVEVYGADDDLPRALQDAETLRLLEAKRPLPEGFRPGTVVFEEGTRHPDGTVDYRRAEYHDPGLYLD